MKNSNSKIPDKIVFFDGVCNFCNSSVDFLMKKNKKKSLYYASLQSDFARDFLPDYGKDVNDLSTIYYYKSGKVHQLSGAALRISLELKGLWPLLSIFLIIPPFLRDFIYRVIAKRRYKIMGKRETCRIPNEEEKKYFIS